MQKITDKLEKKPSHIYSQSMREFCKRQRPQQQQQLLRKKYRITINRSTNSDNDWFQTKQNKKLLNYRISFISLFSPKHDDDWNHNSFTQAVARVCVCVCEKSIIDIEYQKRKVS